MFSFVGLVCFIEFRSIYCTPYQGRKFAAESFMPTLRPRGSSQRNVYVGAAGLQPAAMVSQVRMAHTGRENVASWMVGQALRWTYSAPWLLKLVLIVYTVFLKK